MSKRGVINVGKSVNKKNKKYKNNKIKFFLKKFIFYSLSLGFLVLVVWMLFFSDFMKVQNVNIYNEMLDSVKMKQLVEGELSKKFFNYFPRNNLILVSKNNIESLLKKEFKLISLIEVKKEFPNTISVKVTERKKVFIWCDRNNECLLVDESGKSFYKLNNVEKDFFKKDMVMITDKSNKQAVLNEKIVSQDVALFCQQIIRGIETVLKIKMRKEMSMPSSISEEITLMTEEGWGIHFNTSQSIKEETEILRKILEEEFIKEKRGELEYIDLRLKGKVIYKFRGSENEDENKEKKESEAANKSLEENSDKEDKQED